MPILLLFLFLGVADPNLLTILLFVSLFALLFVIEPVAPPFLSRAPRRLTVTREGIDFLRGSKVRQHLAWERVARIEWGTIVFTGRGKAVGKAERIPYIRFVGFPLLSSIHVTGREYRMGLVEVERAALAVAEFIRPRGIPVERTDVGRA